MDFELPNDTLWKLFSGSTSGMCQTYTLCLEVSSPQAVMVLIEVHDLETIELPRHLLDLLFLAGLDLLDAFSVPLDVVGHRDGHKSFWVSLRMERKWV